MIGRRNNSYQSSQSKASLPLKSSRRSTKTHVQRLTLVTAFWAIEKEMRGRRTSEHSEHDWYHNDTEKDGRKTKSQGLAWQPIERVRPPRPSVYTESEAKEAWWDTWGVPQPPGSFSPAYGTPPTANRWHFYWLRKRRGRPAYSHNPGLHTGPGQSRTRKDRQGIVAMSSMVPR